MNPSIEDVGAKCCGLRLEPEPNIFLVRFLAIAVRLEPFPKGVLPDESPLEPDEELDLGLVSANCRSEWKGRMPKVADRVGASGSIEPAVPGRVAKPGAIGSRIAG